jgi:hypothetical protein
MTTHPPRLEAQIRAQAERVPSMYGQVDFSSLPERYTEALDDVSSLPKRLVAKRPALLANTAQVELLRAYTLLGDVVADAYAALLPQYGARRLIAMLDEACRRGVEHVPQAPAELAAFIGAMERMPAWLDRALIEEGARQQRNAFAHLAPFAVRGAFFATFMNQYAALPMARTGTLSTASAARRVKETATFFSTSVLPGALERHGEGFRAAAMVRLMHSMVRFNLLTRDGAWNVSTHGIPIPQVDQMPAGLINAFLLSRKVVQQGRDTFTREERALIELARYRCYLLGLPEELLSDTPQGIIDLWLTRAATLRAGFDDATCGALIRATMAAELWSGNTPAERLQARMERSFAKLFFLMNFADNDRRAAARVGIDVAPLDYAWAVATVAWIAPQMIAHHLAGRVPVLRELADRHLVHMLHKQLERYGHAEYVVRATAPVVGGRRQPAVA